MANAKRSRVLAAPQQTVWELISDPDHMPRWWPGVERVESVARRSLHPGVQDQARPAGPGRLPRGRVRSAPWRRAWEQELPGTPFARVLNESVITIALEPMGAGTEVTIAQLQKLRGYSRTGGFMLRRATAAKLDEALDGLERLIG